MLHLLIWTALVLTQGNEVNFVVRQVTTDRVYLTVSGEVLPVSGDLLTIHHDGILAATLEVDSVSSRYIACKIMEQHQGVLVGDLAVFKGSAAANDPEPIAELEVSAAPPVAAPVITTRVKKPRSRRSGIRGSMALQYQQYEAGEGSGSYTQPSINLNIRGDNLANGSLGFRLRTRSRYVNRDSDTATDAGKWNNRLYSAFLRIGKDDSRLQYHLGRLISNKFSGVGYIDGAMGRLRLGQNSEIGLFAGAQPDWQKAEGRDTIDKYGAYFNHRRNTAKTFLDSTVAVVGEYQAGEVNREFLFISNRYGGSRFSLYQSAEVDINRDWRSEKAGSTLALSNLYLQARYTFTDRVSMGLGYDNRQSYYTYELRNRDEVFFDNLSRQGYRASLTARMWGDMRLNAGFGLRTKKDEDDTQTWYANLYKANLFGGGWTIRGRVNGFSNPYTEGINPSLQVSKRWGRGHHLSLAYSDYTYTYLGTSEDRNNSYLRLEGYFNLGKYVFVSVQLEENTGDDAEGQRIYLDLGVRF